MKRKSDSRNALIEFLNHKHSYLKIRNNEEKEKRDGRSVTSSPEEDCLTFFEQHPTFIHMKSSNTQEIY